MNIAIHHREGSFSVHWINYCKKYKVPYKLVNCYNSNIIDQLKDCDGLMWHWPQWDSKSILFARQLTYSLEQAGKKVFPDSLTCWHFDDKLGQKYLFEALGINSIPTWIFYDKSTAIKWIKNTEFPKVFKLRGGASSENVILVRTKAHANKLIKKAFGRGFNISNQRNIFYDRISKFKKDRSLENLIHVTKGIIRMFIKKYDEKMRCRDKGYIYFQDFVSGNNSDIRLVIVGNKCFGIRRYFRKNDFRASGSGIKDYNHKLISIDCVKAAFDTAKLLKMQSVAFDFILQNNQYKLIEVSYAFVSYNFPGYWDSNLKWYDGPISPQKAMIEDFIDQIKM